MKKFAKKLRYIILELFCCKQLCIILSKCMCFLCIYPTVAPGSCSPVFSGVRVVHLFFVLCMYYFSYFMLFVVFLFFPCLVFVPGLHSFDLHWNRGSLITLSTFFNVNVYRQKLKTNLSRLIFR